MGKRGLSPVIATVLLVSLALVLAGIVFLWAKNFIGEAVTKEGEAIELLCDRVKFQAEAYGAPLTLYVENTGSVPLYGVEIREKSLLGEVSGVEEFSGAYIAPGETGEVGIDRSGVRGGDEVILVPILLGETEGKIEKTPYVCDSDFGREILVG
jgi:flagellin-like protein